MSASVLAALPAQLAPARAPSCATHRALRAAPAAPGAGACRGFRLAAPCGWQRRCACGRAAVRRRWPLARVLQVRLVDGQPPTLSDLTGPNARADVAVPGKRAEELAKNFDHLATEERLYRWCVAPHVLADTRRHDLRRRRGPRLDQVGRGRLLPPHWRRRAVRNCDATAQRDWRPAHGPRHVCHAAGAAQAALGLLLRDYSDQDDQDIMIRWARMNGKQALWIPGACLAAQRDDGDAG
jgi:hypothetical protein